MPFNLPILLTWLRIVAIPLLIAIYYLPASWATLAERDVAATLIFVAAALTDWADGYLARRLNQTSAFGAFLDPVADKLMVAAALIVLVQLGRTDAIIATIIIGREITISALREWMAKIGAAKSVAVSMLGKVKTAAQMLAIPLLLYRVPLFGQDVLVLGNWLIWIAALLTLWSMGYYLRMAWPEIAKRSAEK
ncbi:CDP-diacylglycerol--glycerol-3-phosphate 3-phosphatidyltransferase [Quatrionicoccus australiensis]|uniref:CDP-diacylglycerol--glycerol-3-phosphate 3-phosphatidyltransferase n=1 Tax=Quatrionicoccus australiensis TaxID=138118 RepID=UPI001CF9B87B|nr:CDP-diacylglycerol--glycerol-3-phosphate 3-phosphatidyltransferase [Quatrionicoccus australiensis]MCB4361751.1 CDP-diacylglycerol--glycerol-3-phosphate 3-phosphatidyltransferase [Quatrionicoccus australiensis]